MHTPFVGQAEQKSRRTKVIVEFSSPNIAREFTAAHLKSTILGAFVANIYEAMNYSVVRINYLGDWGKNIGLLAVGCQRYGPGKGLDDEQTDLFRYIHDLYTKMEDELRPEQEARKKARDAGEDTTILESQGLFAERDANFKLMEDGEPEAMALWRKLRDITVQYYADTYRRLNIKFDEYSGESQVSLDSEVVAEVESVLKDTGVYEEQNGAWVIDFDKHGTKLGTAALRDRNGSTTYLLRDIATVFHRLTTYAFDKMVYVVCEQDVHFRQVRKAIALMGRGDVASKLQHITFARVSGHPSPSKSARLLGDILDQCETYMREAMAASPDEYQTENCDEDTRVIAINTLVIQGLSSRKSQGNGLDFNLLISSEGETGTTLQRCYTRLCSAIARFGTQPRPEEIPFLDYSPLCEPPWSDSLRLMARFPEATHCAFKTLDPGPLLSHLFRIAEELTGCLDEADEDVSLGQDSAAGSTYAARAVLFENGRQVLENGMKLLGAAPVGE
jgi:arginyl-tRNA synthetase